MSNYICPICNTEYKEKTATCSCCGFDGIEYVDYFNQQSYKEYEKKSLFKIYKYAKKVAMGEIKYSSSKFTLSDATAKLIDSINEDRGLAYISAPDMILCDGALAFQTKVEGLIADVKGADCEFLNESHIKMLFLGKNFRFFTDEDLNPLKDGYFISSPPLRYIWVDSENPYFCSDNNVLFNKDQTELICYARMRPEEEYTVPQNVKKIKKYAFYYTKHLKKLYIHKNTEICHKALKFYDDAIPEIIYID